VCSVGWLTERARNAAAARLSTPPAIESVRRGAGAILFEAEVVRLDPHSSSDDHRKYRSPDELAVLAERDPIFRTESYLIRNGVLSADEVAAFRASIKVEVDQAAAEADGHPQPATSDLLAHIYSDEKPPVEVPPNYLAEKPVTMIDAINHGLREEMVRNSKIVMWGEDIADPKGGVFGVTRGLDGLPGSCLQRTLGGGEHRRSGGRDGHRRLQANH